MSSSELAVSLQGIGKYFRMTDTDDIPKSFRERARYRLRHPLQLYPSGFWALRDISFEAERGEIVGIIGGNGAGKSTLLKILSRITDPTEGEAHLYGRTGSLLEVGTGFHSELTGRENIYLNGSVLGLKKRQVDKLFDEIVGFSGVEKFLDTPVKRYSSGMVVRLAFAVAAHLEPEILIIDEVLSVGDAEFQKRCLGKLGDVATNDARTVLFVSHNLASVESLCDRCVYLANGQVQFIGDTEEAITRYLAQDAAAMGDQPGVFDLTQRENPVHPGQIHIKTAILQTLHGTPTSTIRMGDGLSVTVELADLPDLRAGGIAVRIRSDMDQIIASVARDLVEIDGYRDSTDRVTIRFASLPLLFGTYLLDIVLFAASGKEQVDRALRAVRFFVASADVYSDWRIPKKKDGVIFVQAEWSAESAGALVPSGGSTPEPMLSAGRPPSGASVPMGEGHS